MTVKELIDLLAFHDPSATVLMYGDHDNLIEAERIEASEEVKDEHGWYVTDKKKKQDLPRIGCVTII